MTTASAAYAVCRAVIEASRPTDASNAVIPLRWQNDDQDSDGQAALPDTPAPFIYTEFLGDSAAVIEIGGGRGANRHRNNGRLDVYVFVPRGQGLKPATDIAEQVARLFRPLNSGGVVVDSVVVSPGGDGAALKPMGISSLVENYYYATVGVELRYDLIG